MRISDNKWKFNNLISSLFRNQNPRDKNISWVKKEIIYETLHFVSVAFCVFYKQPLGTCNIHDICILIRVIHAKMWTLFISPISLHFSNAFAFSGYVSANRTDLLQINLFGYTEENALCHSRCLCKSTGNKTQVPSSVYGELSTWNLFEISASASKTIFILNSQKRIKLQIILIKTYLTMQLRKCKRATSWQNQQNGMCAQRRLRSALVSAQSDQSLRSALSG